MKKVFLAGIILCSFIFSAFAQDAAAPATATMKLTGTIIDNLCADAHKADIAEFIKTHPKTCALMPACAASGYSIYSDGKLMKFDKTSSAKIEEFLKNESSKLDVDVEVTQSGDVLTLLSIKNRE